MKSFIFAGVVLIGLVAVCVAISWLLKTGPEPKLPDPTNSRIVATQDLRAFTLPKSGDLEVHKVDGDDPPKIEDFIDRYLLMDVKKGSEVRDEMLAARDLTQVLNNATLVSIPATATTSLGGQLRVGELVDLFAPPSAGDPKVRKVENVVVLSAQPNAGSIILAVPNDKRDDLPSVVAGLPLLVSRKIVVSK